ncbi:hypothetical protein [Flavobacterium sp. J27]|uniref:hypothetical protein n=1 Tax=Flavobacterium sp. J27 TaxID=2060419 RepID=UPI0010306A18|nr:hypothetical protein [Flavobacterium sp. J27]
MKRILAIFVLLFAFGLNSYAQEKNEKFTALAKKDSKDVVTLLELGDKEETDFFRLFYHKYEEQALTTDAERKKIISNQISKKLQASLTPEKFEKLKKNTTLYERVVN